MKKRNTFDRHVIAKDRGSYTLMLKDRKVFEINLNTGCVIMLEEELMPLDLYLEWGDSQDTTNNLITFYWWCANRILSLDREYAKEILNFCGLRQATTDRDKAEIALQYKCLSLRDFYWVEKTEISKSWKEVSLFTNSLSNAVVDLALQGKSLTITNSQLIDSDLATDGTFPKAWLRENGIFWLLKGDRNNSVDKEVFASEYLRELGFDVLAYHRQMYNGEKVSVSKCFTDENTGYITAGNLVQNYDLDYSFPQYDMMLLCDYLVGNSDRHQDNWGYLFNDRCQITGFAPIFDFNHAFEASEDSFSLPELLRGRKITMLCAAKEVAVRYGLSLDYLEEKNIYTDFINRRIKLLAK